MGTTTRTMLAAVTTLTAAALLTGCAGGDEGGEAPSSSTSSASDGGSNGEDSSDSESSAELDEAAAEAGIDPDDPPEPIGSATLPGKGSEGAPTDVRIDLFGLKRQGELMVLTAAVTPDKSSKSEPQDFFGWIDNSWYPQVIDTENLKVHDVVTEKGGGPVMTKTGSVTTTFGPGQTYYMYAVFAAPPQDVDTVTVKLADGAPAVTGVTIQ